VITGIAPTATVRVNVNGTAVEQSVIIQQGQRVLRNINISSARPTYWGTWSPTGGSSANRNNLGRLRDELASASNFGPTGAVVPSGIRTFLAEGSSSRGRLPGAGVYIHLANIANYNATERVQLRQWLQGSPYRVLVITNELNSTASYLQEFGMTGVSQGNTALRTVRADAATAIPQNLYNFLFVSGPFSPDNANSSRANIRLRAQDSVGGKLSGWPTTFVPIVWYSTGSASASTCVTNRVHMGIDPVQRIVFVGEPEIFGRGGRTNTDWNNPANVEFVRNVAAWIINTTQQGAYFTGQFH
jgi:hypothetical protein